MKEKDIIGSSSMTTTSLVVSGGKYYTGYWQMYSAGTVDRGKLYVKSFSNGAGASNPTGTVYGTMIYTV